TIGNLSNLIWLEINGSAKYEAGEMGLTSTPPELNNLTNLKGLHLEFNSLTEFPSITNLSKLIHIAIGNNDYSESSVPEALTNMKDLVYLRIQEAHLTGSIPDFSNSTKLEMFKLNKNNLSGPFPNYLFGPEFSSLHSIILSWNGLTGTLDPIQRTNLSVLDIAGNEL